MRSTVLLSYSLSGPVGLRVVSVSTNLVVRDGNGLVDNIADGLDLDLQELLFLGSRGQQLLLLLLKLGWDTSAHWASQTVPRFGPPFCAKRSVTSSLAYFSCQNQADRGRGVGARACLLLGADLLLDVVDLGVELGGGVGSCAAGECQVLGCLSCTGWDVGIGSLFR